MPKLLTAKKRLKNLKRNLKLALKSVKREKPSNGISLTCIYISSEKGDISLGYSFEPAPKNEKKCIVKNVKKKRI